MRTQVVENECYDIFLYVGDGDSWDAWNKACDNGIPDEAEDWDCVETTYSRSKAEARRRVLEEMNPNGAYTIQRRIEEETITENDERWDSYEDEVEFNWYHRG